MLSEFVSITLSITCSSEEFAQIILKSLEPENKQINEKSKIEMSIENQILVLKFTSYSSLSTIRNTFDDIISTINTSENIYRTVKSKE